MSSSETTAPASIVRPGRAPEGPPGWEDERIRKEQAAAEQRQSDQAGGAGGLQSMKDRLHKIGEKLDLVEPKDPAQQTQAQQQNASTGPEFAPQQER
ncbi:uncharacterized protein PFL1_03180 [Pseudozyma flocculosa PF-1]|uniref:Uncharacterized protein n=1 Tax=Pseudozyma flocculosa PF-1 TaxID=1277687 RepID=A0A061HBL4_9BASI|nr:uncharacterized protein PFL1_03180 [Pseudozyma flocculosa PF-1]EPQ29425.1 hypothetical protein PFL1_03180 [Pseudozyma flocculosa PF-1]